jgi:ribosomal protein S18 acetylase RimI-like enzyme
MIRQASEQDLDALVEGNLELARETEGLALDPATLRAGVGAVLAGRVPGRYFVLEAAGRVVAQLMITFEWSDWRNRQVWWIQSVYVWPQARQQGAYRRLYAAVKAEAEAAGAGGIRLYVDATNTRAQAVYAALGMNGEHYRVFEAMFDVNPA